MTDAACARTIALPIYPGLGEADQDVVIEAVRAALSARTSGAAR